MSRSILYPSSSPEGLTTRLPGVNALLAGVTLNNAEHCSECEHSNCFECSTSPIIMRADSSDHRSCILEDRSATFKKDTCRWRAGTFSTSSPATPLLQTNVKWPEVHDRRQSTSPASTLLSLSYGSSAPSTPASPRSPLLPQSSILSARSSPGYGYSSESPSASDGSEGASLGEEHAAANGNPPNLDGAAATAGLFAVFRPSGTSLAVAASGKTLSAMQEDWKSRLPGDTVPTAEEMKRKPLSCPYCRRRFDRPSIRRTHINSHTGERPYECSVSGCHRRFSVLSNKYRHERSHKGQRLLDDEE